MGHLKGLKTIKSKIMVCMSFTIVISLLVLGIISVAMNYMSTDSTLNQVLTETAKVASTRVAKEMESYLNIAIDAGCTEMLASPTVSAADKKAIIDERVSTHGLMRGNIIGQNGISIFDGNDYSDRAYYQNAIRGNSAISEPIVSKITGELSIMIAAPLWKDGIQNSTVVGVVYFVPPETFLNDIVSGIKISENSHAYVINNQGTTIADVTLETITVENIEQLAQSDKSLTKMAELHSRMHNEENGFGEYKENGTTYYAAFSKIDNTEGWSICISTPKHDFMAETNASIVFTVIILVAAFIISTLISAKLASGIGTPIQLCANRLNNLAKGDLKSEIPQIKSNDEVGILAGATETIIHTMSGIIQDINYGLSEIANGDLTVDSQAKELYVGDYQAIAVSIYSIIDKLSDSFSQINGSAGQVASGADHVSSAAQALSQGATEQASSVEELAATITEISGQVKDTAENAANVRQEAETASNEVSTCNKQMENMISAMANISEKSEEIGKIIKTIEDIAFQTNILALNAAVEAARAGTAGKGFAVVADEVRNLANKSQKASKDTSALIESTEQAVQSGREIADATAQSLIKVVGSTDEVKTLIERISDAANEQAISLSQVTQGIDQISSVVQTNSATAEQSAAASEELLGQARLMKNLVDRFHLKESYQETIGVQQIEPSEPMPQQRLTASGQSKY